MDSSLKRPCCVPGCKNRISKRHVITTDKRCREIWLCRINNNKLFDMDDRILKNYRICQEHFENVCVEQSGKLKKYSLPTLHLPGYVRRKGDEFLNTVSEVKKHFVTPEKLREAISGVHGSPLKSIGDSPRASLILPQRTYGRKRLFETSSVDMQPPSTSRETIDLSKTMDQPSTSKHEWTHIEEMGPQKISSTVSNIRHSFATLQEKQLHQTIIKLKRIARRANAMKLKNKTKETSTKSHQIFLSQLKNQRLKSRGRRFSLEDKIFALSAYKQSAKGYRFLSKIFSLPSRKTLLKLLNRIPFYCGINKHIFKNLKDVVAKLKDIDKYCVLIFDEIFVNTGLTYTLSKDYIEGVVDFGDGDRRARFADHALVFMLKGIHRKWKQPVCYIFCESSTPTANLIKLIKDVVINVHQAGLEIVASICDQGATNSAAINNLLKETNAYCLRNNIDTHFQGYLIEGREIIHLYDTPIY